MWELERAGVGVAENVSEILGTDIGHDDNLALKQRDVINDRPGSRHTLVIIGHHLEILKGCNAIR